MGETVSAGADRNEFALYELLGNERRRHVVECLLNGDRTVPVDELAEEVATRETGESPPPSNKRHSVYTTLTRVHIPKLADHGVVNYDEDTREVTLDERVLNLHLEIVPDQELSWAEYYLSLGVLAMLTIGLAFVGVTTVAVLDPILWAAGYFGLYIISAGYQLRSRSRRLLGSVRT